MKVTSMLDLQCARNISAMLLCFICYICTYKLIHNYQKIHGSSYYFIKLLTFVYFSQKKPAIRKGIKKPKFKSKLKPPPNFGAQVSFMQVVHIINFFKFTIHVYLTNHIHKWLVSFNQFKMRLHCT
jgi:hypothetical protein